MTAPLLTVDDLHVEIRSPRGTIRAVDGVTLTVAPGEIVGVVGESGCGKSTLLRAVAGVPVPAATVTAGAVSVAGEAIRPGRPSPHVAMVFQDPLTGLDPVMRVGHQIAEVPRRRGGASKARARAIAIDLMKEVGIPDPERRFDAFPHQLSGGLRQRVLIAAALSAEPTLLLCDEPTTALDVTVQDQIVRLLQRLRAERGLAILYVTHDLPLVGALCDRIDVMYAAQVIETGPAARLLVEPRHPYTRGLLDAAPVIARRTERLSAIPGQPPSLVEPLDGCRFAPRCAHAAAACLRAGRLTDEDAQWDTACVRADDPEVLASNRGAGR
jgi:oligopeptide/dipeptide ABC transporter ATP-binding protein